MVAGRDDLIDRFLTAVDLELSNLGRPKIQTLFIGGGTPTQLSADQLNRLMIVLKSRFDLQSGLEFSLEANPEDIDEQTLDVLSDHGVNRISLGVQSFTDQKLKTLERSHSPAAACEAIEMVASRIENVSIDLIFAAPGESLEDWRRDLETALTLPIMHLSTYALTFEKGTSYWNRRLHGQLQAIDESVELAMYQHTLQACEEAGLEHYEISNFAKPGYQCQHNLAYWHGCGWYAAGPGAARFVDGRREVNHRSTTTYLSRMEAGRSPVAETDAITTTQYARERAAFGIRMIEGIDLDLLSNEAGVDLRQLCGGAIEQCLDDGLLRESERRMRLTNRGVLFADTVAAALLG